MKPKICPSCNKQSFSMKDVIFKGVLGKRMVCSHCKIRVKVKPKLLPLLLSDFISQALLTLSVAVAIAYKSWAIFALFLIFVFAVFIPCYACGKIIIVYSPFKNKVK